MADTNMPGEAIHTPEESKLVEGVSMHIAHVLANTPDKIAGSVLCSSLATYFMHKMRDPMDAWVLLEREIRKGIQAAMVEGGRAGSA